ncbi:MAG: ATP-grasp domain-containing protein [Mariniblastus sp.]|nr:ATP-grasp domain-containing protein [Mariniblastus sp.]
MKIGVLAAADNWVVRELERVAGDEHQLIPLQFTRLSTYLEGTGASCFCSGESNQDTECLDSLDAILVRPMPAGSLQQVVFRMNLLHQLAEQHHIAVLNPPPTIEASVDKYLCLEKIRGGEIDVPATCLAESASTALSQFRQLGMDSVVKPLFGSGGKGIQRVRELPLASELFSEKEAREEIIYQQAFIDHGDSDFRLLVIGERVLGMRRTHPGNWITNIQQGATAHPHRPTPREIEIARLAAARLGASLAGVDLLYDRSGHPWVIEVNACPGWQALASVSDVDISALVLEQVLSEVKPGLPQAP